MMLFKPGNVLRSALDIKTDGRWTESKDFLLIILLKSVVMAPFDVFFVGPESSPSAQGHPQRYQGTERPAD